MAKLQLLHAYNPSVSCEADRGIYAREGRLQEHVQHKKEVALILTIVQDVITTTSKTRGGLYESLHTSYAIWTRISRERISRREKLALNCTLSEPQPVYAQQKSQAQPKQKKRTTIIIGMHKQNTKIIVTNVIEKTICFWTKRSILLHLTDYFNIALPKLLRAHGIASILNLFLIRQFIVL